MVENLSEDIGQVDDMGRKCGSLVGEDIVNDLNDYVVGPMWKEIPRSAFREIEAFEPKIEEGWKMGFKRIYHEPSLAARIDHNIGWSSHGKGDITEPSAEDIVKYVLEVLHKNIWDPDRENSCVFHVSGKWKHLQYTRPNDFSYFCSSIQKQNTLRFGKRST